MKNELSVCRVEYEMHT